MKLPRVSSSTITALEGVGVESLELGERRGIPAIVVTAKALGAVDRDPLQ
ncbi:MAG: hypothetical protein J7M39_06125 [Anaerolineae bacterium]|nr:hypothetical protein [Anaerolineae bacterium]